MRKLVLPIMLIGLFSCKSSKEDTCKCFQESANNYMLKGLRPTVEDLAMTCKINKDDYNPQEKAELAACAQEVMESVNTKTLIPIKGKENPPFPSYEFATINDFFFAVNNAQDDGYKYLNTTITVKTAYNLYTPSYLDKNEFSITAYNVAEDGSIPLFGKLTDFDTSKLNNKLDNQTYNYNVIWDTKEQKINPDDELRWVILDANGKNPQDFINRAEENQDAVYKYKDVNMTMYEKYLAVVIERMIATDKYKNLVSDLADGRYKLADKDEMPKFGRIQYSFSGVFKKGMMFNAKISNIQPEGLPEALKGKGQPIDIRKYILNGAKIVQPSNTPKVNNTPVVNSANGKVIADKTFFYKEADLNTIRKGYLIKGQSVSITRKSGKFVYCIYGKTEGWMLASDVQ